jgi:hypothetical protein
MLVCLFVVIVPLTNALAQSWLCENTNLKRYVEIYYPNSPSYSPCSVIYRKPTEDADDRILWQAQNNEGYCKNKAKAFVEKLETWGWRCSINEPTSENKSVNSKPTSSSLSVTALEKKLFNAVKLGNVDNASSIRFDKYIDVLEDFNENNYIGDDPTGYISEYHVYYLLNEQANFMGHKVIVLTEPLEDAEREGCCPDRKFKIYLETVGTTEPLRDFAESNNCYFKDRYIWSFGGMYFHSGQYAVLDCQTD